MLICKEALNKSYFPQCSFSFIVIIAVSKVCRIWSLWSICYCIDASVTQEGDSASILFQRFTRRCVKLTCFGNALGVPIVWNPYRITPIHWLMAQKPPSTFSRRIFYWRTQHLLLRFLCRKGPCRQREELGSKRSVSFLIQRTRVTRVNQDVLFYRFTWLCIKLTRFGNDKPNTPS